MESFNTSLFLLINASGEPPNWAWRLAMLMGEHAIWLVPATLLVGWLRGNERSRKLMLQATAAGLAGLLINQLIGLAWSHPRPFALGMGHTLIKHVADSSFPSDHLTLWWSVAFSFMLNESTRRIGMLAAVIGMPIAWARIYLGVHFPMDMLGSLFVSAAAAWLTHRMAGPLIHLTLVLLLPLYRRLMGPFIRRGWFAP